MEELELELKQLIIETLRLENISPKDIQSEAPLFITGLGLDSIDALELAMVIRKRYGVVARGDDGENSKVFASVRSLAAYVAENQPAKA